MSPDYGEVHHVLHGAEVEAIAVTTVEGRSLDQPAEVRVLADGDRMLLVEVVMAAGQGSPPHTHDHESVGYVARGRIRTTIAGEVHELVAGDGFRHPAGAEHDMAAIDREAVWIEVKSPPGRTWDNG